MGKDSSNFPTLNLFKITPLYNAFPNTVSLICFVKEKNDGLGGGGRLITYLVSKDKRK